MESRGLYGSGVVISGAQCRVWDEAGGEPVDAHRPYNRRVYKSANGERRGVQLAGKNGERKRTQLRTQLVFQNPSRGRDATWHYVLPGKEPVGFQVGQPIRIAKLAVQEFEAASPRSG
jgi:hypothetical protein